MPLTVPEVITIEKAIFDKTAPMGKQMVAGLVRSCIGARLRHSDASRITRKPEIDDDRPPGNIPDSDEDGYVMMGTV